MTFEGDSSTFISSYWLHSVLSTYYLLHFCEILLCVSGRKKVKGACNQIYINWTVIYVEIGCHMDATWMPHRLQKKAATG